MFSSIYPKFIVFYAQITSHNALSSRFWIISKNGFTEKAIDVAEANEVLFTDGEELRSVKKAVVNRKRMS